MTPLHIAVENAHIKIVEYLVGEKIADVDVDIQDNKGVNEISAAA